MDHDMKKAQEEIVSNLEKEMNKRENTLSLQSSNHREAFCMMTYQCESCKKTVAIWNSRDGVTPFGVNCVFDECKGSMKHIRWIDDVFFPEYEPKSGDYVFMDMPAEYMKILTVQRVETCWDTGKYAMKDFFKTKEDATKELMKEFKFGQPMLSRIP